MGKDELGDILQKYSGEIFLCKPTAEKNAKSAILAWVVKQLPEKITHNDNLDFTRECPSCGSKEYDYWSGWIKGEEGQMEPEEGYCKTCGFQWQQGGEGWIKTMMEEARDWTDEGLYFHGRNDAIDEMKRRFE